MTGTEPIDIRLPLNRLTQNPLYRDFTPPLTPSEYEGLKSSILSIRTLLHPIIVEFVEATNSYDIIDGYNRERILRESGFQDVACRQVFTEAQRLEAIRANVNRRQLTESQRKELLTRSQALISEARKALIAPLAELHKSGELTKYIGPHNVHYLMNASKETQELFYTTLGLAFSTPTPSNARESRLMDEMKQLRSNLALAETQRRQLEQQLQIKSEETTRIQQEVEDLHTDVEQRVEATSHSEKGRLERQLAAATSQLTALKTEHAKSKHQVKVLEGQVKSAESEMAAAQQAAKDAEKLLHQKTSSQGNPHLIRGGFESLIKMGDSIETMIHHAHPLHPEDIKLIQHHISLTRGKLDDIEVALLHPKAEIVPIHRHIKGKPGQSASA